MHLFLIAAVPISYVYALTLRDETGEPSSRVGIAALRGALAYLIELAVLLILRRFVPRVHSGVAAYFHSVLFDFAVPLLGTFLLFLWFTPHLRSLSGRERRLSLMSFMVGAFALAGIMDLFLRAEYFGVFDLFLLPALRVTAVLIIPVLYRLFVEETFWVRGLYIAAIILVPFAFATVYLFVVYALPLAAILSTAGVFCGAWALTIFGRRAGKRA